MKKPAFYIVFTATDNYRFTNRSIARAFCAACKMAGYSAVLKAVF